MRTAEESRDWLAAHLRAWERHRVKFGAASRAIPRGIGTQEGGRDGNAREVAHHALTEYAQVFRAGCIDGGPDGPPPPAVMRRYAGQVPQGFGFTVMLSDDPLVYRFSYGHPDRGRRGELNPGFLSPGPLREHVCAALDALDGALETVVLRVQPVYRTEELRAPEFVDRLDRFLGGLPRAYRYAVDLGTPAFNVPEYRACLRGHGVAHVLHHAPPHMPYHAPSHMPRTMPPHPFDPPPLIDQVLVPGILAAPFCVARVHAGPEGGRDDDAGDEALTLGVHELIRACGEEGVALTVLVGDDGDGGDDGVTGTNGDERRGGGIAPAVLTRLLHSLDGELARRSPLRRRAA